MTERLARISRSSLFRFLVVGGLGSALNLLVFFILADKIKANHNISSIAAFTLAVTQNYFLNEAWSFSGDRKTKATAMRYASYVGGNALGLLINIAILNLLLSSRAWSYKAIPQAISIAAVTVFNFLWARYVVFARRRSLPAEEKK